MEKRFFYDRTAETEKQQTKNTIYSRLRTALYWRLAGVLAFVYVGDALIHLVNNRVLSGFLINVMGIDRVSFEGNGLTRTGLLLAIYLQYLLSRIFPGAGRFLLGRYAMTDFVIPPFFVGASVSKELSDILYIFVVGLVLVIMLILSLLPYVLGGWWFVSAIYHKVEEVLAEEHRRINEQEQKRNLMLSDIAHDIKTPITSVCGYTSAMLDHIVPEEREEEYLQTINAKALRISELINILFEYVKMDSTGYTLHTAAGDLGELVLESCALLYTDLEDAGLNFDVDVPECPMPCEMDKGQMSRVVTNLLTNAVKYLNPGNSVLVRMWLPSTERFMRVETGDPTEGTEEERFYRDLCAEFPKAKECYVIAVADDGAVIEEELAEHIFEPFSRGDKTRSTKGGSGLGLSIASKIVHLHGGRLLLDEAYPMPYRKAFVILVPMKQEK